jgi:hypothetical protein
MRLTVADDLINQLSYYITNEVRMPAGFIRDVIDEIERLRADLLSTRLAHIATLGELMEIVTNDDPLRKVEKH